MQAVDNPTYAEMKDVCSATGLSLGVEVSVTSYCIDCASPSQHIQSECILETQVLNPAGDQEKSSVAYCSNKNHNFANIGHKNMNDASF